MKPEITNTESNNNNNNNNQPTSLNVALTLENHILNIPELAVRLTEFLDPEGFIALSKTNINIHNLAVDLAERRPDLNDKVLQNKIQKEVQAAKQLETVTIAKIQQEKTKLQNANTAINKKEFDITWRWAQLAIVALLAIAAIIAITLDLPALIGAVAILFPVTCCVASVYFFIKSHKTASEYQPIVKGIKQLEKNLSSSSLKLTFNPMQKLSLKESIQGEIENRVQEVKETDLEQGNSNSFMLDSYRNKNNNNNKQNNSQDHDSEDESAYLINNSLV